MQMEMFPIREKADTIIVRQRGREIAQSIGFNLVEQTRIAYSITELALELISFSNIGHMTIRPVSGLKGESPSGIEVRLFDHFRGPIRLQMKYLEGLTDHLEWSHDQLRGTMITIRKWLIPSLRNDSPIYAAGEE